jgi:hypothetical protein
MILVCFSIAHGYSSSHFESFFECAVSIFECGNVGVIVRLPGADGVGVPFRNPCGPLPFRVSIKSHQIKHALRRIGVEADGEIAGGYSGGSFAARK